VVDAYDVEEKRFGINENYTEELKGECRKSSALSI